MLQQNWCSVFNMTVTFIYSLLMLLLDLPEISWSKLSSIPLKFLPVARAKVQEENKKIGGRGVKKWESAKVPVHNKTKP
jgi:hypothetical protein